MNQTTLPHQPYADAQLALSMLVRHVQRIASNQAARIASGEVTPQQACSAVVRQGASLAVTAQYFGADDLAMAIAEVADQEAARLNPEWRIAREPAAKIGASA
ncbi:hypothetical protein KEH56_18655 (plasmid) [Burkholderia cenocepacia]|uniref:hypothetical protein n=1 Tax=Burkholderia cenocepacia TaxID=95486 RepID=UPI001BAD23AA|nr:hypothetical protein [Burkholderia cenocepacia]QUN41458.1 hypothetical protein KEH56_18655 [Burkholderia cenocepacia]QUO30761.1 hypothetical protein KEH57_36645 [Burkholderia cenocepacia]